MKWVPQDIELYLKSQDYIDTAVIPLIPVAFGDNMKQAASMSEFITLLSTLLERQFTGRILLLPTFTYLKKDENREKIIGELESWVTELKKNHLKHIILLTSDSEWKTAAENLTELLIWIPAIPLENLENSQKISIVDSQVKQLLDIFTRKWHEHE